MSAHGLFSSVFSCSPSSKSVFKRRLRQTISLDPALMRHYGTDVDETTAKGDFTWNSMSGRSVGLEPVPLQSLSELERVRLQDVAFSRLLRDYDLGCQITIPKDGQKRKKSLRKKLDSLSKEKSKDKETAPQAFGIPLSQVISNDRAYKQRLEPEREGRWDAGGDPAAFSSLRLASSSKRSNKELSSSNSSLSSTCETPHDSPLPCQPQAVQRIRRRGGVSVDCITDLDDNQSRLLEALQLSLPVEPPSNRKKHSDKKLSLNPIYRQVPRVIDCCCQHLEKHGLQTVGIFRVGSSKKRARQLREEFDLGMEVQLDEDQSVHDVAALLKEFLRDMPEPLLTRELYTAFINSILLDNSDQVTAIQLLIYLLPPCNSDTLQRLLHFLSTVAAHAEDRLNSRGSETTGNKMTSLNLATIFGPNLLHMLKTTDKEFVVQSFARAEESTAIISVVQTMITNYKTLFMVPSDLQNEVLMSVLETDADVVDYLLRRKASQYSSPSLLRTGESFSLSDRRSSSDSNKPSSGEASPYDNNSPVPSESPLSQCHGDSGLFGLSGIHKAAGNCSSGAGDSCTTPSSGDDAPDEHFWGDWHSLFRKELLDSDLTGYHGDVSKRESYGLSEELHRHQGNSQLPVGQKQTSLGEAECRPHLPLTRCSSSPHDQRRQRQPELHQNLHNQSRAISSDDLAGRTNQQTISPCVKGSKTDGWSLFCFPEPLKDTYISNSTPSLSSNPSGGLSVVAQGEASRRTSRFPAPPCPVLPSGEGTELAAPECQRERWHIWQLLSTDSVDTLPETLV